MLLHQVLLEDAPSPRKLNQSVPRDLETICLKCLEKDPGRRYQTAGELRDDLKNFCRANRFMPGRSPEPLGHGAGAKGIQWWRSRWYYC